MNVIENSLAQAEQISGKSVIVDVREPKEYRDGHLAGAINLPSTSYADSQYTPFEKLNICLICESGQRAKSIYTKLNKERYDNLFILKDQMKSVKDSSTTNGWTVDRQFRMTLGILLAVFLALHFTGISGGFVIPIVLSTGLIVTAIIDRCYMRMGIAMLPWNKGKSIPK